jgi:DNA-binding response OmpR family regulator
MVRPTRKPCILVVEDEILLCLWMIRVIEERGWIGLPVTTIDSALTLLKAGRFDGALLDINIHGLSVDPVMDVLYERDIPFAVVTARVPPELHSRLENVIVIDKPCSRFEVEYALESLFEVSSGGQGGVGGDDPQSDDDPIDPSPAALPEARRALLGLADALGAARPLRTTLRPPKQPKVSGFL